MDQLSLVTLNTNGLRSVTKRRAIFSDLHKGGFDIIFLQETHSTKEDQRIWSTEWGGDIIFSNGRSNARGVAILFKKGLNPDVMTTVRDKEGRMLIVQVSLGADIVTLINIYAPTQSEPRQQDQFIGSLEESLADLEITILLMGGDFNTQLDEISSGTSHSNRHSQSQIYANRIISILEEYALTDIWKNKNPTSNRGTFHRGSYSARLDYIFISSSLVATSTIDISPHPLSDHSLLHSRITFSRVKRGPGYWRFDNRLLSDKTFVQDMTTFILDLQQDRLAQHDLHWEWTKFKIKEFCIQYSIKKRREERRMIRELEDRLKTLAVDHDLTSTPDVIHEVNSIKRELAEIKLSKAYSTIIRSKVRWSSLGEKPTAYFLGLEKRRSRDNTVTSLFSPSGRLIQDNQEILAMEKEYFTSIYSEDPEALDSVDDLFLSPEDIPTISEMNQLRINRPFTQEEFSEALKALNRDKCPGSDGITPEFYSTFWELLQADYMNTIDSSLDKGLLTDQQCTGLITLVPKKDLDRRSLSNWRPITLLNTDLKILSKAVATRIQSCIKEVVTQDQTGFISGRSIRSNLLNIQSVIDYSDATQTEGILLAVDYSKAFDKIRWELIYKALQAFGFGEFIIAVVMLLFQGIKSCVLNAGFSSGFFSPSRGIHQGCCCSPTLFVLTVELLAIAVRKSQTIKSMVINGTTATISQYADDTTFIIKDVPSLHSLLDLLDSFTRFSGLEINPQKSHLLLLGNFKDPPSSIRGIRIEQQVKILGMFYKPQMTEDEHYSLNFAPRILGIQSICNTWLNRKLSLKGKITLINTLMISILHYPCACSYTPARVLFETKKVITQFLWDAKRPKVAYNLMIQPIDKGGLRLADLESRIFTSHLSLIRYFWHSDRSPASSVLAHALNSDDLRQTILCKVRLASLLPIPEHFKLFRQVLLTWARFHLYSPTSEMEMQQEPLWNNEQILISKKPALWQQWKNAGILQIKDLIHTTESRFLSHQELGQEYDLDPSFLQVLQIRSAIPSAWKRLLRSTRDTTTENKPRIKTQNQDLIDVSNVTAKKIYTALVAFKLPHVNSQDKWNEVFPLGETNQEDYWKEVYTSPYHACRDTKLQAFHFKVTHRTIPCNRYLSNIHIRRDDTCSYCDSSDTLQHFFFYCETVSTFWMNLIRWLAQNADIHVDMNTEQLLFGLPRNNPQAKCINFILILAKFFIFRQRLFHQGQMDLTHFLRELKMKLQIEKLIFIRENKPNKFRRWHRIFQALG